MKKIIIAGLGALVAMIGMTACSDFEPKGYEEVPNLPKATNVTATEGAKHVIDVTWELPTDTKGMEITDVRFILNADNANPISLGPDATSYKVVGQPMDKEYVYTVKICYDDRYITEGASTQYTIPYQELPGVSNLTQTTKGRKVTLKWTNPQGNLTGIRVLLNGAVAAELPATATEVTLAGQAFDTELVYTVETMYDDYYPGKPATVSTTIAYFETKMGFLLLAPTIAQLPDDDEIAAATWFSQQEKAVMVQPSELATLDTDEISVLWIMVDRVGIGMGWEKLPAEVSSPDAIEALRAYSKAGGSLYLSNMATQLTVPLEIVPQDMAPTTFSDGNGGNGTDYWTIMPYLGWIFRPDGPNAGQQGYYDRTDHAIFQGLTFEDPNDWGFNGLPLIGPGMREDHNCMWDCNLYGKGTYPDVISHFEAVTGSLVLATWGHVQDHCVAGLVDFFATPVHGRCVANGFAAYEWNQNSGPNEYQHNVEQLTANILNYLK
ncbi:MAG: DUF4960 domain-containing protein [Muribaculaceae bacterium]|nr:DUF4960 domain-containing protein [Muribaculaceae bacterium]